MCDSSTASSSLRARVASLRSSASAASAVVHAPYDGVVGANFRHEGRAAFAQLCCGAVELGSGDVCLAHQFKCLCDRDRLRELPANGEHLNLLFEAGLEASKSQVRLAQVGADDSDRRVTLAHVPRASGGDDAALPDMLERLQSKRHTLAARHLGREREGHTLQPTALVNEAYLKLVELRWFKGLDIEETAAVMGVSTRTVERGWRVARAWQCERLDS